MTGRLWRPVQITTDFQFCSAPEVPNSPQVVAARLKAHVQDASNNNMLIFPEGTCVNNDFAIMFKKGGGVALDGDF